MCIKDRITAGLIAFIAGLFALSVVAAAEEKPSGTITFEEIEVSFIGSAKSGGGMLTFQGKKYPFHIGGLGVGGFGLAKISGVGEVYRLNSVSDFEGLYGGLRAGIVVGETGLKGGIWMENVKGPIIHLRPKREGLGLSMGADGIVIELTK